MSCFPSLDSRHRSGFRQCRVSLFECLRWSRGLRGCGCPHSLNIHCANRWQLSGCTIEIESLFCRWSPRRPTRMGITSLIIPSKRDTRNPNHGNHLFSQTFRDWANSVSITEIFRFFTLTQICQKNTFHRIENVFERRDVYSEVNSSSLRLMGYNPWNCFYSLF